MLTRRRFLAAGALAGAATLLDAPRLFSQSGPASDRADGIDALYARSLAIDTLSIGDDLTADVVNAVVAAGLTAVVFDIPLYPRDHEGAVNKLAEWNSFFLSTKLPVMRVENSGDLAAAKREKKFGVILACQDASILGAGSADYIASFEMFHRLGLRVLQLTHNNRSAFGDDYMEKHDGGLSYAGAELVGAMNRLGAVVDLSHCSRQTLLDTVALSKKPCMVTHAGCKALAATARNKSDEEIKALGAAGGVFSVYDMTTWLTEQPTASLDTVLDHVDHAAKLIGADHVGFGSDGAIDKLDATAETKRMAQVQKDHAGDPSFEWPVRHVRVPELNSPARLHALAQGLARRGYKDADIAGIIGGNFARLFQQVCG
jgi:membrane dipeptidase